MNSVFSSQKNQGASSDDAAAAKAFTTALEADPENVEILLKAARTLGSLDRWKEALPLAQRAHALRPEFTTILSLGAVLVQLGEPEAARPLLEQAHRLAPDAPEAFYGLGKLLFRAGNSIAAESCFRRLLENPLEQNLVAASFQHLFQSNLIDMVRTYLPIALGRFPDNPLLQFSAARLDHLDGRLEAARDRLHALQLPSGRDHRRLFLLGKVEDELKNPEAAMAAFTRANRLQGKAEGGAQLAADYRHILGNLEQAFSSARVSRWAPTPTPTLDDGPAPVFLVGFPRSGTTLLDTILLGHPEVAILEETPTLLGLQEFLGLDTGTTSADRLDRLDRLSDQEWADLRQDYRARVAVQHDGSRSVVIDKLPLNIAEAGVIHRFFPEARFILALRHPCDVVLSCFMQSFRINRPMANFLDLEETARLYDRVMALWCRYNDLFSLKHHKVRYEDLIQDVPGEITKLLAFLGLDYDPAVEDHTRTARERGYISTPSNHQVAQPLYHQAAGRWQRYATAMAPLRPILDPWLQHWGYDWNPLSSDEAETAANKPAESLKVMEARALIAEGRVREAERQLEQHLKTQRNDITAWWLLVDCREKRGEWGQARDLIRHYLTTLPRDSYALNRLGLSELQLKNRAAAAEAFMAASAEDPENVEILLNAARTLGSLDRWKQALPFAQRAHARRPEFKTVISLGAILTQLNESEAARPLLEQAHRLAPNIPEAWFELGKLLLRVGNNAAAEECYHRLLKNPLKKNLVVSSFQHLMHANLMDMVRTHLPVASARFPDDPYLQFFAARLEHLDGHLEAARNRLRAVQLPDGTDHRRLFLLGKVEDGLRNPEGAMEAFIQANRLQGETGDGARMAADYRYRLGCLEQAFSSARAGQWAPTPVPDDGPAPVFLVGFPRSGTTLLDTVLMSHPAVFVLEEAPTLFGIRDFFGLDAGTPNLDRLDRLSDQEWLTLRRDYRARVAAQHDGSRPLVIDKMPLNMVNAGIIHRVFPEARFILVLRHPCDVVLSCFMQSFQLNPAMAGFLDLQDGARLYDRVMALWCRYDDLFSLKHHKVRYENLIRDVRGEMASLLAFLELAYDPAVEDHTRTARERGYISTPSYDQVTQPFYHQASGRWQRYAEALAPLRPILDPWIRHWGYDLDPVSPGPVAF